MPGTFSHPSHHPSIISYPSLAIHHGLTSHHRLVSVPATWDDRLGDLLLLLRRRLQQVSAERLAPRWWKTPEDHDRGQGMVGHDLEGHEAAEGRVFQEVVRDIGWSAVQFDMVSDQWRTRAWQLLRTHRWLRSRRTRRRRIAYYSQPGRVDVDGWPGGARACRTFHFVR
jgi:hypothetical protein